MKAGQLRHRLEIQDYIEIRDPNTGAVDTEWATVATVWGSVEPLSARDFIQSAALQSQVTARITIRYRPDMTAAMRILHRDTVYNIVGILPDKDSGLEYITLPVSTGVNQG